MDRTAGSIPRGVQLSFGALCAGFCLLAAHNAFGMPWPSVAHGAWHWLYNALELGAVGVCAARAIGERRERTAWLVMAVSILSFSVGDLYYVIAFANTDDVPVPSLADLFYLASYPGLYIALVLLFRARTDRFPAAIWLDGITGALAVAALGAAVIFSVAVADTGGAPLEVATNLAYPLADLLLLAVVVGAITLSGSRLRSGWTLLAVGLAIFAVVDSVYLYQIAVGTYQQNKLTDLGWPAAMIVIALAAWRPPRRIAAARLDGWRLLVIPTASASAAIALEIYDHYTRLSPLSVWLAGGCLLAVILRMGVTFADNRRMLAASREEAITDSLTGLRNRRGLADDLERRCRADRIAPFVLAIYDLDGFKGYNDSFGHSAGDALLARLGRQLGETLARQPAATGYRMGGDEFCVVVDDAGDGHAASVVESAALALSETGEAFTSACSHGAVRVPEEVGNAAKALVLADERMYERKGGRRGAAAGALSLDWPLRTETVVGRDGDPTAR